MAMDAEYLLELTGGDRALVREIMGDFLASDVNDRQQLAEAVAAGNAAEVQQAAHRIKGAARAIGAGSYADAAGAVEREASTGADLKPLVEAVELAARDLSAWAAGFE